MLEDEWALLPVLYTTIRTSGNPLDMVVGECDRKKQRRHASARSVRLTVSSNLAPQPLCSRPLRRPVLRSSPPSFQRMSLSSLFLVLAVCAIGFLSAAASPHSLARRSYHNAVQPLQKRTSGQFTFFAVGMGACGKQNTDDDFVST